MASDARRKMLVGAVSLLARRGLQATSFTEVLKATGAPRGSIYHHFPDGKEQLVVEALDLARAHAQGALETTRGQPATVVVTTFLGLWRDLLVGSQLQAGCAVAAVTVAAESEALLDATATIFRGWRSLITDLLTEGGMRVDDAPRFATVLLASVEGAVVLARAERDLTPFDLVAEDLSARVQALTNRAS